MTALLRSHSYRYDVGPLRNPRLRQVSVRPTIGSPWIAGATRRQRGLHDGRAAHDLDRPRRRGDVARAVLGLRRQDDRPAHVGGLRDIPELERERRVPADQLTVGEQADLLEVAARVGGRDVDLDRVARGGHEPVGGRPLEGDRGRRRGVGRGRQQVLHRPRHQRVAGVGADLLEPEPERHRVGGRQGESAGLRLRRGHVELDLLLSQRLLDRDARPVAQSRGRLGARRRDAVGVLVGVVARAAVDRVGPTPAKMLPATGSIGWPL